ncbi:MAG: hypothetical protein IJ227_02910 [Mogibacterium sp.]|nr:hypothetical protein [Mogibacterium sp.]
MAVNGIGGGLSAYTQYQNMAATQKKPEAAKTEGQTSSDTGVSVEFSDEAMAASQAAKEAESTEAATDPKQADRDAIIKSLNEHLDAHTQMMQNLVNELLGGKNKTQGWSMAETYRKMAELADPETIEKAKKDIAEDGEWGVEKTSERMFEMAKALSGDDPTKADEMIAAVKKGLKQATQAWGEDLPDISQKTVDATIKKLEEWRDGLGKQTDAANQAAQNTQSYLTAQAQSAYIAGVA